MFGCYRKGDANDPETYVAAITATLARYPEDVIRDVTHPATGLPVQSNFLPTVAEVHKACEIRFKSRRDTDARQRAIARQLDERKEIEASKVTDPKVADGLKELAEQIGRGIGPSSV